MSDRTYTLSPHDGEILNVVDTRMRVLMSAGVPGKAVEIFEIHGARDSGPPMHAHPWNESYLVLEGELEVTADGQKHIHAAGAFINIPGKVMHAFQIVSDVCKFMVITSPGGAGAFFRELDKEVGGSSKDIEAIVGIALKHGLTLPVPVAA